MKNKFNIIQLIIIISIHISPQIIYSQNLQDIKNLSLEELLEIKVTVATGYEESLLNSPASITVITAKDIKNRGYTYITEIFPDLISMDITNLGGPGHISVFRQRGFRSSNLQTLFLVNGKRQNLLWSNVQPYGRHFATANIERIEILNGPASVVYGADAVTGVINIITKKGKDLKVGEVDASVTFLNGSFGTSNIETYSIGNTGLFQYSFSANFSKSDEPDFSDRWGFLDNNIYNDKKIWGPILDFEINNKNFGEYHSPTNNYNLMGDIAYKNINLGFINWHRQDGYGPFYPADRVQNNSKWNTLSKYYYIDYKSNENNNLISKSELSYRSTNRFGEWAEAIADWNPGMSDFSYISLSSWNLINKVWKFKHNVNYEYNDNNFTAEFVYKKKELTKNWDVPGYWGGFSSTGNSSDPGPYGFGAGVGHSSDSVYIKSASPVSPMPSDNLVNMYEYGSFINYKYDNQNNIFNGGIRYDNNSIYGETFNPRITFIRKLDNNTSIKIMYGEAFLAPSPEFLWGGFNGRRANLDLKPEKLRNIEGIIIKKSSNILHETSLFYSNYTNVINSAINTGDIKVYGFEYKSQFSISNFISNASNISGYLNYTYAISKSDKVYNFSTSSWSDGEENIGDIAPHKINMGINIPLKNKSNFFLSSNYVSNQDLYQTNPIRGRNEKLASYFIMNGNFNMDIQSYNIGIKIFNIFDKKYFQPGLGFADSGDDFSQRSQGWANSLIPQPGRSVFVKFSVNY